MFVRDQSFHYDARLLLRLLTFKTIFDFPNIFPSIYRGLLYFVSNGVKMTLNISVRNVFFLSIYVASSLEIQAFQPAVVPIRAITTLTLKTSVELNVTSNTTLQCRFKDISVPARKEDGFIFCETPPMRNTDRVPLFLDVDGQLFKTKKPLYLHG